MVMALRASPDKCVCFLINSVRLAFKRSINGRQNGTVAAESRII